MYVKLTIEELATILPVPFHMKGTQPANSQCQLRPTNVTPSCLHTHPCVPRHTCSFNGNAFYSRLNFTKLLRKQRIYEMMASILLNSCKLPKDISMIIRRIYNKSSIQNLISYIYIIFFVYGCFVHTCLVPHVYQVSTEASRGHQMPQNWSYTQLRATM